MNTRLVNETKENIHKCIEQLWIARIKRLKIVKEFEIYIRNTYQ